MTLPSGPSSPPIDRIQQNLLAASERRLLTWLCAHMPRWVTPDLLTGLGMVGAFAIFAGYAASSLHVDWLWLAIAAGLFTAVGWAFWRCFASDFALDRKAALSSLVDCLAAHGVLPGGGARAEQALVERLEVVALAGKKTGGSLDVKPLAQTEASEA